MLPPLSTKSLSLSRILLSPHRPNLPFPPRRQTLAMTFTAAADGANPQPSSKKAVRVVVKGRVQGVFFRDWTVHTARELGLNGWVRNRRDGTVEAVFSGDPAAVDEMVERRCRVGPPSAAVTALNTFPAEEDPGEGFDRKPTV